MIVTVAIFLLQVAHGQVPQADRPVEVAEMEAALGRPESLYEFAQSVQDRVLTESAARLWVTSYLASESLIRTFNTVNFGEKSDRVEAKILVEFLQRELSQQKRETLLSTILERFARGVRDLGKPELDQIIDFARRTEFERPLAYALEFMTIVRIARAAVSGPPFGPEAKNERDRLIFYLVNDPARLPRDLFRKLVRSDGELFESATRSIGERSPDQYQGVVLEELRRESDQKLRIRIARNGFRYLSGIERLQNGVMDLEADAIISTASDMNIEMGRAPRCLLERPDGYPLDRPKAEHVLRSFFALESNTDELFLVARLGLKIIRDGTEADWKRVEAIAHDSSQPNKKKRAQLLIKIRNKEPIAYSELEGATRATQEVVANLVDYLDLPLKFNRPRGAADAREGLSKILQGSWWLAPITQDEKRWGPGWSGTVLVIVATFLERAREVFPERVAEIEKELLQKINASEPKPFGILADWVRHVSRIELVSWNSAEPWKRIFALMVMQDQETARLLERDLEAALRGERLRSESLDSGMTNYNFPAAVLSLRNPKASFLDFLQNLPEIPNYAIHDPLRPREDVRGPHSAGRYLMKNLALHENSRPAQLRAALTYFAKVSDTIAVQSFLPGIHQGALDPAGPEDPPATRIGIAPYFFDPLIFYATRALRVLERERQPGLAPVREKLLDLTLRMIGPDGTVRPMASHKERNYKYIGAELISPALIGIALADLAR